MYETPPFWNANLSKNYKEKALSFCYGKLWLLVLLLNVKLGVVVEFQWPNFTENNEGENWENETFLGENLKKTMLIKKPLSISLQCNPL